MREQTASEVIEGKWQAGTREQSSEPSAELNVGGRLEIELESLNEWLRRDTSRSYQDRVNRVEFEMVTVQLAKEVFALSRTEQTRKQRNLKRRNAGYLKH